MPILQIAPDGYGDTLLQWRQYLVAGIWYVALSDDTGGWVNGLIEFIKFLKFVKFVKYGGKEFLKFQPEADRPLDDIKFVKRKKN